MKSRKTVLFAIVVIATLVILIFSIKNVNTKQEELKLGKYTTEDGLAWVILKENNEFEFNRHVATSYLPIGNYSIDNDKLVLHVNEEEEYVFTIEGEKLIFQEGGLAKSLVEKGTVFKRNFD